MWHHENLALLTDLYQLTMANGYWLCGKRREEAVFHLFFRRPPFGGGYAVAAGLEPVLEIIEKFHYSREQLDYLASLEGSDDKPLFHPEFLDYLANLKMTCDLDACPEGSVVFPYEPLVRVSGPLIQCQLLETPLLNAVNFPTLIATKASRVCQAADGDTVLEFGLRRAQGIDGAMSASRAAYIGGCHATSNVLAGQCYDIPVRGTHAHSWVQAFDSEMEAFETYAQTSPNNSVLLVDTYNTLEGVRNAIKVGQQLKERGYLLQGVRLDSGDLAYLSRRARTMLDEAGMVETQIVASNELDEVVIAELKRQGARIDIWGVGTHLVTGGSQAALDGVYKLSAIRKDADSPWEPRLKLSEQMTKTSNPGVLQVRRFFDRDGQAVADALYDVSMQDNLHECTIVDPFDATRRKQLNESIQGEDLLVPVVRSGKRVNPPCNLKDARQRASNQLKQFHSGVKRFLNPHQYVVGMEKTLYEKKIELIAQARALSK